MAEIARRVKRFKIQAGLRITFSRRHAAAEKAQCQRLAATGEEFTVGLLALGRGFHIAKSRELCVRDVAQISHQIHRLVVAGHHMHATTLSRRLLLESHQQVHHLS